VHATCKQSKVALNVNLLLPAQPNFATLRAFLPTPIFFFLVLILAYLAPAATVFHDSTKLFAIWNKVNGSTAKT